MVKRNNIFNLLNFYNKRFVIEPTILDQVRKDKNIIHGERALNRHLPSFLDVHTEDYDVFSQTPRKSAIKLEKELDRKFGGDFFVVRPARHKGTFKVKSKITDRTVADFTKPKKEIPFTTSFDGINYRKLESIKEKVEMLLKDETKKFRRKKDLEALRRIKVFEFLRGKLNGI